MSSGMICKPPHSFWANRSVDSLFSATANIRHPLRCPGVLHAKYSKLLGESLKIL